MGPRGHAFISYVREDGVRVDRLQEFLEAGGVRVWRDISSLGPGEDWKAKIREAIGADSLAFVACFSKNSEGRRRTYQRSELLLAIEELRERPPDKAYLMPVRFDDCKIPELDIGAGRTLSSLTWVDLFEGPKPGQQEAERLLEGIRRIIGPDRAGPRSRGGGTKARAITARPGGKRGVLARLSGPQLSLATAAVVIVIALAALVIVWLSGGSPGVPAPPPGHRVTDNTGAISLIVPDSWGDVAGDGWNPRGDIDGVSEGEHIGPGLNASTNIYSWFSDLTTPGLFAGASKMLVTTERYKPSSILSAIAPANCFFASQQPSRADGLTGYQDGWTCKNSATRYETVALWPRDHGYIAFLEIKIVTPADQASANRAIASLSVRY
jgi:TIR domain